MTSDYDLLWLAREGGVEKSLWQSFRRQLEQHPSRDSVNFPCVVLDEPWKRHDGGPCPVRHEEVLVYTRSQYSAEHQFRKAKPKRCWPESVNWHWGPPGSPTTPIDVLQWRKV